MASNYTTNYGLPLWAADDAFLRTEFNDAHEKIEDALTEIAAGVPKIVTGSYSPNGIGLDEPLHISLGFRPKLVLIWHNSVSGYASYLTSCAMVLDGALIRVPNSDISLAEIEDTGFFVQRHNYGDYPYYPQLAEQATYLYLATG